jgi:tetratricopeptide (TPR) repeat protein
VLFKDRMDWEQAGVEYRRAIALAPGDAETHYLYATYLAALGRLDEAVASVERARELDPASMAVNSDYSWLLYLARRYDDAIRQARETLKLVDITQSSLPNVAVYGRVWSYWVLVHGSWKKGDEPMAASYFKEKWTAFGQGAAVAGLSSLQQLMDWKIQDLHDKARRQQPISLISLAASSTLGGHADQALDALEQECRKGGDELLFVYTAVEPVFDPLHGDPRFARIVDCTGLPRNAPIRQALHLEKGP